MSMYLGISKGVGFLFSVDLLGHFTLMHHVPNCFIHTIQLNAKGFGCKIFLSFATKLVCEIYISTVGGVGL